METKVLKVGIAGFGNVGRSLYQRLQANTIAGVQVTAIGTRNPMRLPQEFHQQDNPPLFVSAEALHQHCDLIVECATYEAFRSIVEPALQHKKHTLVVSCGALVENMDLLDLAEKQGGLLQIANGALPGLDMIRCAREKGIKTVTLVSHIKSRSFENEPYIKDNHIDLKGAEEKPLSIFSGTARDAAKHFPRHFNVGVALSLAGIGLDRTKLEIYAFNQFPGTHHKIILEAEETHLELQAQNLPSQENRRTSQIVASSIIAAIRSSLSAVRIGS